MQPNRDSINIHLYKLLKETLELKDNCQSFTLICEMDSLPIVTQTYSILNGKVVNAINETKKLT